VISVTGENVALALIGLIISLALSLFALFFNSFFLTVLEGWKEGKGGSFEEYRERLKSRLKLRGAPHPQSLRLSASAFLLFVLVTLAALYLSPLPFYWTPFLLGASIGSVLTYLVFHLSRSHRLPVGGPSAIDKIYGLEGSTLQDEKQPLSDKSEGLSYGSLPPDLRRRLSLATAGTLLIVGLGCAWTWIVWPGDRALLVTEISVPLLVRLAILYRLLKKDDTSSSVVSGNKFDGDMDESPWQTRGPAKRRRK
jgi:hypothetical protein